MNKKICPCCGSNNIEYKAVPIEHFICLNCLHIWRKVYVDEQYYRNSIGRSSFISQNLNHKNELRLNALRDEIKESKTILEVGCAEGSFGEIVKNEFNVLYDCIEISKDFYKAKQYVDNVYRENILKFKSDKSYDLVLSFHVLEHIYNCKHFICKLKSLIKPNGKIIIDVPNFSGNKKVPWDLNIEHVHLFNPASISILFERNGLDILNLETNVFESSLYNDSIRIIAKLKISLYNKREELMRKIKSLGRIIIFGIGGDFNSYLKPYIKNHKIIALIDTNKDKIGKKVIGFRISAPDEVLKKSSYDTIIIGSYRFSSDIKKYLISKGIPKNKIVPIQDLFI